MTVKELMEILKDVEPDMEVTVCAPDSGYYTDEFIEYDVDKKTLAKNPVSFTSA